MAPGDDGAARWRAREHLHLALQPDAHVVRPCSGCDAPCPCSASDDCPCACTVTCHHAPERLSAAVARVPGLWLPLVWELSELRVVEIVDVADDALGGLSLRTESIALVQLLTQHLARRFEQRALRTRWLLHLESAPDGLRLRLGPEASSGAFDSLTEDISALADGLARALRGAARERAEALPGLAELTPRERVVLLGLLDGLSVRTLARHLFVSRHTVRNQMRAIYDKLGVRSHDALLEAFAGRAVPHEVRRGRMRRPSLPPRGKLGE